MSSQPNHSPDPFDVSIEVLQRAYALAIDYLSGLATRPVSRATTPEALAAAFDEPFPEYESNPVAVLDDWFARAEPGLVASSGPRFFGYVFGGATPAALAGDLLTSVLDQNPVLWAASPAAAQTEVVVLDWLKELFHLPGDWAGALTSGATMSNLVCLAAARQWVGERLGFDPAADGLGGYPAIPVVSSTEIHASAIKALGTLGLGRDRIRKIPAPGGVIDLRLLDAELMGIDGPVIVIANAGEVNTGTFDSLDEIADRCRIHPGGAWLHVDGAFGLFAAVSPELAHLVRGIERADSVASDGHKWLNVPYDSGFAFVNDADALRAAFAVTAAYVAPAPGAGWDPSSHVPELSRRFRGLAAWCALKAYGRDGYRALVERCVSYAADFAAWVEAEPGLELAAPAPLNVACFRYFVPGLDNAALDDLNRAAVLALQADGRVFVTGTAWQGRAAIRAAFDNWATSPNDVDILKTAVREVGANLVSNSSAK